MKRFAVLNEQNKRRAKHNLKSAEKSSIGGALTGLRVMRPPQAVRVEMQDEQPTKVLLHGMRGNVVAASGPWRSSGDWWQQDPWYQDEWDLEIEFAACSPVGAQPASAGRNRCAPSRQNLKPQDTQQLPSGPERALYRIYYDALKQEWFLRGVYD